jgi:hypothetical protein
MKNKIIFIFFLAVLTIGNSAFTLKTNSSSSEKLLFSKDAGCNINFSITTSAGCTVIVSGTIANCNGNMSSFTGTIVFGGEPGCPSGTVNVAYAQPVGGGWQVPTGYSIAFYTVGSDEDCCTASNLVFIGSPDSKVNLLNSISRTFLEEFCKDAGC